jgi:hypothetical protein
VGLSGRDACDSYQTLHFIEKAQRFLTGSTGGFFISYGYPLNEGEYWT